MNIKRFHAPTSREALAKARMAFGDGTLILSNRPTATGVEVVATAEDTLSALDSGSASVGTGPFDTRTATGGTHGVAICSGRAQPGGGRHGTAGYEHAVLRTLRNACCGVGTRH
jgi:flagellar biosynthesis GTPase FlhF